MQQKYGKTGKFTVFLSNVQNYNDETVKFMKANAPGIPLYNQVRLPHAPCGGGIPHAVLFDCKGNVVAAGDPTELQGKVEALIKAVPEPRPQPLAQAADILGGMKIAYCTAQADKLVAGNPIDPILKELKEISGNGDEAAKEAKKLAQAVSIYVEYERTDLKENASTSPAKTLNRLNLFSIQVKGIVWEKDVNELIAKLKTDKDVVLLADSMRQIEEMKGKSAKNKNGKPDDASVDKAREAIQKMVDEGKASKAVIKEAQEFLKKI